MTTAPRRVAASVRREQILGATWAVAVRRGTSALRIADVAAELGVSSALVHYHFASRENLIAETLAHVARADIARMAAAADAEADPVDRLRSMILEYLPDGADDPSWRLWIEAWGDGLRSPVIRAMSEELDTAWVQLMERVIRLGIEDGAFDCADPTSSAWRLAAVLDGLGVQIVVHDGTITRAEALNHAWVFAVRELRNGVDSGGPLGTV